MKYIKILIMSFVFLILGSSVFAFYDFNNYNIGFHEDVELVIENGIYNDLIQLREDLDMPVARWVDSEEDFLLLKERHEEMEELGYAKVGRNYMENSRDFSTGCQFRN